MYSPTIHFGLLTAISRVKRSSQEVWSSAPFTSASHSRGRQDEFSASGRATVRDTLLAHHFLLLQRHRGHLGEHPLCTHRTDQRAPTHAYSQTATTVHIRQPRPPTRISHQLHIFATNTDKRSMVTMYDRLHGPALPRAGDISCRQQMLEQVFQQHTSRFHVDPILLLPGEPHLIGSRFSLARVPRCLPSQCAWRVSCNRHSRLIQRLPRYLLWQWLWVRR